MDRGPLIVQSDMTLLLEVEHPQFYETRDKLAVFADLVKSPEYIHHYRITPLSLWNAAAMGVHPDEITEVLERFSRYPVPASVLTNIKEISSRYGRLVLTKEGEELILEAEDPVLLQEVLQHSTVRKTIKEVVSKTRALVDPTFRGLVKQALIQAGWPVKDLAGYVEGEYYPISLNPKVALRPYQKDAVDAFWAGGSVQGGSGVVLLPCGAGKTIVGLGVMEKAQSCTLIITTGATSLKQWIREITDKTTVPPEDIGEYSGEKKEIKSIVITTYQILSHRKSKTGSFSHLEIFKLKDWGLIIYDEVHLLPAPVFRTTADLQAKRRLGLTATLVREDGREEDVFSLIGPKRYDAPWKDLENAGWIAPVQCCEIRVPLPPAERRRYINATQRQALRIAAEHPAKGLIIPRLLERHGKLPTLIIGRYISQLEKISSQFRAPLITGKTSQEEREIFFHKFRRGDLKLLVVSEVANFALDLPDATLAIQVSGRFGSRQEEAQRLGRVLRPKKDGQPAYFYSLVSKDTKEQEFAMRRQLFLTEQGYRYSIETIEKL